MIGSLKGVPALPLPPLPEPTVTIRGEYAAYTADQMREYAEQAVLATRAKYCDDSGQPFPNCTAEDDAALAILAMLCTRMGIDQTLPANERAGKLAEMVASSQAGEQSKDAERYRALREHCPNTIDVLEGHIAKAKRAAIAAKGNQS